VIGWLRSRLFKRGRRVRLERFDGLDVLVYDGPLTEKDFDALGNLWNSGWRPALEGEWVNAPWPTSP
jgi:hypothetical protein